MNRAASSNLEAMQGYIAGRMSDVDRDAFEDRLMSDPSLGQELEMSLRLREGLEVLRERNKLPQPMLTRRRPRKLPLVGAAAAALLVLAVLVGQRYVRPSPSVLSASVAALHGDAGAPLMVSAHHTFATLRDASEPPALDLPARGALELRSLTSVTNTRQTFHISLEEIQHQQPVTIGAVMHVMPDADGIVVVYVDVSKLRPAEYVLAVESEAADEPNAKKAIAERFPFKLTR